LGPNYFKTYPDLRKDPSIKTTVDLLKNIKEYKEVFDMDFKYVFMWVHTLTDVKWLKPMSPPDRLTIYQEMYDLTEYLLTEYSGSGKTFMIGNWEGDWLLHGSGNRNIDPGDEKIEAMKQSFQIRQAAIDEAKRKVAHDGVEVFYYVEVNLAKKGMKGERCITESILADVNPDLVSYSSYESTKNHPNYDSLKNTVTPLMDYMESKLQPKDNIPFERRVFIGEYGTQVSKKNTVEDQSNQTKEIMQLALELNLPFALHWEFYNNEYAEDGRSKGMSMISEEGEFKPVYYLHKNYYEQLNDYLMAYEKKNGAYPSTEEFRAKALEVLGSL
jgi:bisphosphoglycerate-dependent phosphoglycerate mutase